MPTDNCGETKFYCLSFSQVDRSFGDLSNVTVYWEVDARSEGQLLSRFGNVTFGVGQTSKNVIIGVAQDEIPELDKSYIVSLVNVSHGRLGVRTSATLTLLASDDPYGVFVFANATKSIRLSEANVTVSLTILRRKGLMGQVCPNTEIVEFFFFFFINSNCISLDNFFQCRFE